MNEFKVGDRVKVKKRCECSCWEEYCEGYLDKGVTIRAMPDNKITVEWKDNNKGREWHCPKLKANDLILTPPLNPIKTAIDEAVDMLGGS